MFFKKKDKVPTTPPDSVKLLRTDIHSHILPGIDDGAPGIAESMAMLRLLQDLGYSSVVTTPHVDEVYYPNSSQEIREAEQALRAAVSDEGLEIKIHVAAEYLFDERFAELLKEKDLLTFGQQFILFECPFHQPYPGMKDYLFQLQLDGYQPVLAHPERYLYWQDSDQAYENLHQSGVMFQLNLMSFSGLYGAAAQKRAESLLKEGMVHFLGSDLHTTGSEAKLRAALHHPLVSRFASSMMNQSL